MWPSGSFFCPKCGGDLCFDLLSVDFNQKCENCHETVRLFRCNKTTCKFQSVVCMACNLEQLNLERSQSKKIGKSKPINNIDTPSSSNRILIIGAAILVVAFLFRFIDTPETVENLSLNSINKLRNQYPSQKNETWYHFMSVLERKIPTVKSIIFLHGEEKKTSECLINELVLLYTKNDSIKKEEITFSNNDYEVKDYGIILERYRPIVKRFRIFITDLNKVTGNIARVFLSLCDEISSDIKPSLFIFTLKFDKKTENLKPIERATTVLRKAWYDLPGNEIFPLLSRIVKNVVVIIPEK